MSARFPRASTRCPTTDTLLEWCDAATAAEVLLNAGVIYADEAERIRHRSGARSDAWYTNLYKHECCGDSLGCERRAGHTSFHYSEASGWWGYTDNGVSAS